MIRAPFDRPVTAAAAGDDIVDCVGGCPRPGALEGEGRPFLMVGDPKKAFYKAFGVET
jgi:hypothetical protein